LQKEEQKQTQQLIKPGNHKVCLLSPHIRARTTLTNDISSEKQNPFNCEIKT